MKKNVLSLTAIALFATALVYTGCKKEDTTAPVITLNGNATDTVSLQGSYTDAGATAKDDEDGDITPTMSGSVNTNQTGTYIITYTATDAAGNSATESRTVIVVNDADYLAGTYTVVDVVGSSTFNYSQTITASTTTNNKIMFSKFADYSGNTAIYATVTGTSITLPSQTAISIGTDNGGSCDVANHSFDGTGATNSNGFVLNYNDALTGPGSCTGAAVAGVATYTKQ